MLGLFSVAAGAIAILQPSITALVNVPVMDVDAVATGVFDLTTAFRLRVHIRGACSAGSERRSFLDFQACSYSPGPAPEFALVWMIGALSPAQGVAGGSGSATG